MSEIMKGTLKCIRVHPIIQEMFDIRPTQPSGQVFGAADVEFIYDNPWEESTACFKDKIYITKINGKEVPKQLAWAERFHTTSNLLFELNGSSFVIEDISE